MPRAEDEMTNTKHRIPHIHYESGSYQLQSGSGRPQCHQLRQTKPICGVLGLQMRVERQNKAKQTQFAGLLVRSPEPCASNKPNLPKAR